MDNGRRDERRFELESRMTPSERRALREMERISDALGKGNKTLGWTVGVVAVLTVAFLVAVAVMK